MEVLDIFFLRQGLRIYRKNIEIQLQGTSRVYSLDKYQTLNNKPLRKIIIPPFFGISGVAQMPCLPPYDQGLLKYVTNPQSPSGYQLAPIEAIDGAYIRLVNMKNQQIDESTPLSFFKNDTTLYGDKGIFVDAPCMDFTQSNIFYPTTNIPAANPNLAIMIIVEYWDLLVEKPGFAMNSFDGGFPV